MRRLVFVICAVFAAASVVSLSTLAAHAQSADQYASGDGAEAPQVSQESTAPQETTAPEEKPSGASPSPEDVVVEGSVSQGAVADPDTSEAIAAREDIAEEEGLPEYHQVVDNATKGAFRAPDWKVERGSLSHEGDYVVAEGTKAARFSVEIPTNNDYSVYVWYPATDGGTARYGVQTASGTVRSEVKQDSFSGGMWVKLGTYAMEEGQRSVQVAAKPVNGGRIFADAVAVVRGEAAPPEEDQAVSASGDRATTSKSLERFSGRDVVRQARKHMRDKYKWGTCTKRVKSCTCLTKVAVNPFGHKLGMDEGGQWKYTRSREIPKSRLRPGDEVFFKENGSGGPITHVGIYSGNGRIVHASGYWGKVVEKEMKYINGYFGAKRFKSR